MTGREGHVFCWLLSVADTKTLCVTIKTYDPSADVHPLPSTCAPGCWEGLGCCRAISARSVFWEGCRRVRRVPTLLQVRTGSVNGKTEGL